MILTFVGKLENISTKELEKMLRRCGDNINPMSSLDIQNEIIKRRGTKYDI